MSRVGEKIKDARLKSGLTQKALAKKLGVSDKYINEVEIGRKVVPESFIDKAAKVLNANLNDINMVVTDDALMEERKQEVVKAKVSKVSSRTLGETSEVWTDAFSSVLKRVNIYDYSLNDILGGKELPNYSNKVEGYVADKVLYLKIEDNDMSGFRIMKDDIAFSHLVKEVSNGIFLIEHKGKRIIRQIKLIGNARALLISNGGSVITETIELNNIKVIAKLERLEISL
ncbi:MULTISPECIES: helix-turn-helix transcriptional regulator [Clostridium]|uniref:Helix-turn-helix transcriptional regulator n=1 Tax=Clostridium cibarium TaxID=2762247 RepID=A0ABR8PRT7_9CLOT|nr:MULTISPECIES: helix-turn-helix transcriptional regulator [Clostridium]MBD7910890.1 helix-turn-helix transcriptional regulator [Clostridium cibarium]